MGKRKNEENLEQQHKARQNEQDGEQKPGFGDKKLEGPNRPAE
ncbi:hypothetical protein B0I26_11716 [Anoxybacillus vitaminiphilus]|uniref:Uncharacterized protein n=1 Tax=Paranoxybacillus vitaminiphilus TaxID=581036 RepID=A0A327Y8V7_9BACL|nr:hypothetical protein [Anoxybacillus vitaminiphilus]RAK16602.1 hypothetical protein B0I26_11716 [Anoxybacillus vitaminiphilus]